MNGIEILSSTTIYNTILPGWIGAIGFIILIIFSVILGFFVSEYRTKDAIICAVFMICSIILMSLSLISDENSINHIEYKVIIDDSVSMNEFLDKYEILDQEGKIYIVREKSQ